MSRLLKVLVIALIIISCDESEGDSVNEINETANYWGCWKEANGNIGVYDIILTENQTEPHTFTIGEDCESLNLGEYDAVFRNDTLIIDDGLYEYWCFIVQDTLYYSAYVSNASTEVFVKQ